MKTITATEYRIGPRSVLTPGSRFRATGGPYYEGSHGRESMAHPGPFRFICICTRGRRVWIEAYDRNGCHCVLQLAPRERSPLLRSIVRRPYRVVGRILTDTTAKRRKALR